MPLRFSKKESKIMAYIIDFAFLNQEKSIFGNSTLLEIISDEELVDNNFITAVYRKNNFSYPKFFKMDNLSKTGFLCSELLKENFPEVEKRQKFGVICFNRISSLTTDKNFENTIIENENYYPSPALFVYTLPNIETGEICIRHKLMGESSFYVMEKFDSQQIFNLASDALNFHDYVLLGWSDLVNSQIKSFMVLVSNSDAKSKCVFDVEMLERSYKELL